MSVGEPRYNMLYPGDDGFRQARSSGSSAQLTSQFGATGTIQATQAVRLSNVDSAFSTLSTDLDMLASSLEDLATKLTSALTEYDPGVKVEVGSGDQVKEASASPVVSRLRNLDSTVNYLRAKVESLHRRLEL